MLAPPPAGVRRYPSVVPGCRSRMARTRNAPRVNSPPPGSTCRTVSFADKASSGMGNTAGSICWRRIASRDVVPCREPQIRTAFPGECRADLGLAAGDHVPRGDPAPADGPGRVPHPARCLVGEAHRTTGRAGRWGVHPGRVPCARHAAAAPRHDAGVSPDAGRGGSEYSVRHRQRAGLGGALRHSGVVAQRLRRIPREHGAPDPRRDVHASGARRAPRLGPFHFRGGGHTRGGRRGATPRAVPPRAGARGCRRRRAAHRRPPGRQGAWHAGGRPGGPRRDDPDPLNSRSMLCSHVRSFRSGPPSWCGPPLEDWEARPTDRTPVRRSPYFRSTTAARTGKTRTISTRSRRRSEEHTSELQSRSDLVCRLLLEKKKKNKAKLNYYTTKITVV